MHNLTLLNPALGDIRRVSPQFLRQLEKAPPRFHVAVLVDHQSGHYATACRVFFLGDLPKQMEELRIMRIELDRMDPEEQALSTESSHGRGHVLR